MILRLTLVGLIAAGLLGFGLLAWVATHPAGTQNQVARIAILAAARAVPPGELIKPDDLTVRRLTGKAPPGAAMDSPKARRALDGAMVRRALSIGEVILPSDVLRPGDHGFLAAVLQPGMRAITVGVDLVSGTAGLIWPGDKVDLILTEKISNPAITQGQSIVAETVLSDVRVIAIDQRLIEGAAAGEPTRQAHTVTLEVTEAEAQKVQVAVRLGRLSLSVRSAQNVAGIAPGHRATWASDVSPALASVSHSPPGGVMNIWQGAANAQEFKF